MNGLWAYRYFAVAYLSQLDNLVFVGHVVIKANRFGSINVEENAY